MKKVALFGGLLALVGVGAAYAGGQFPNYPQATSSPTNGYATTYPLTGNELIPADTQLSSGIMPQTEVISAAQLAVYASGYNGTYRNVLIGGDFGTNPWVRGTSTSADIANTLTYHADRWWNLGGASSAINVSQQTGSTDVFAGTYATLRFQRKSGNADTTAICTGQVMETVDSLRFAGNTAVFSFTAKVGANYSAANSVANVTIAYGTGTNESSTNFAAGSWTGYAVPTLYVNGTSSATGAVTLTTSFVRNTVTATIPSTAKQIGVKICYTPVGTAGANDWLEFGQAQLEATGQAVSTAVASVFETMHPTFVQVRAQRHAWVLTEPAADVCQGAGYSTATTGARIVIANPVTMRAAPTVSSIGATLANTTWKVQDAATPIVLSTPFLATYTANTVANINLTATTGASQTVGRGVLLCGAGGGGKLLVSADL